MPPALGLALRAGKARPENGPRRVEHSTRHGCTLLAVSGHHAPWTLLPVVHNFHRPILLYPELPDDHVMYTAGGVGPGIGFIVSVKHARKQASQRPAKRKTLRDLKSEIPDRIKP